MKKLLLSVLATVFAFGMIVQSPAYADEVTTPSPTIEVVEESEEITETATPTVTVEAEPTEETTSEIETSEETEVTIVLSEEATAFIQNVNDAENNKENILIATQEYVDAYVASFDAEGEEATAAADALIAEKEEAFFNLFDQGALLDAYDALSEEEKNSEEVINAKATLDALVLSIDTIMNTEEPTDEPVVYSTGVVVNVGSPTTIDLATVTGNIDIKSDGLWVGGVSEGETGINPDGYEFTGTAPINRRITVEPNNNVDALIILNGVYMESTICIQTTASNTTVQLIGTNTLIGNGQGGGALLKTGVDDYTLTITGNGSLTAKGVGTHAAAIGSRYSENKGFSNLLITGGATVDAVAGLHMPAIGAACGANYYTNPYEDSITTNIIIDNATVTAHGGAYCAGIGSGWAGVVDGIIIRNGAQVTAYGGTNSPGIGSGGTAAGSTPIRDNPDVKNISIEGGNTHVWAYGDQATNMPGIGCGKDQRNNKVGALTNIVASPNIPNWASYIKYGTSATNYAFTTSTDTNGAGESLATPISAEREFATFLQAKANEGVNVYYTEVYFGLPHDEFASTDKADIGANNYSTCAGSFNWADTDAAKTQLLSLAKVSGHDQDGNLLSETDILNNIAANATAQATFNNQIQAIFDANANNATGNYLLTFEFNYVDNNDHTNKTMKVSTHIQFRDACSPTQGGNNPTIAASNAVHPTGGAAFTKAQLIGLTEGTASNYLGLDADLINDITLTQADVDKINAAKTSNKTGIFPLTYTYVTTTDGTAPVTLTKTVYVTLTDTGTPFTPKDPNHPEKGQNMGPQFGANDYITKTGGAAFDTTTLKKMQNVSAKDSNGTSIPLDKLIPDPTQLAAINAAKVAGQVGDFPLKYTFEDVDGTIREVETTVKLRDNEGTTPTPVEKKDDNNNVIGYVISTPELGSNNHTTPTGGAGWTEDEIKDLLDVIGKDANGVEIPRTDFTVDATQLATLNAEKLAGKCGTYPITFTYNDNGTPRQVISYVTLNGCYVPPGPSLVTYLDCYGNTVKIEWVDYKGTSSAPNNNFDSASNVTADLIIRQNNCGISTGYKVPNTGDKE